MIMSDFPNIISSKIISSEWNDFWSEIKLPATINEQAKTLVLSTYFAAGGAEDAQLKKMMQACQLSEADYNVVQAEEGKVLPWHSLRTTLDPVHVILLGITPNQLGIAAIFNFFYPTRFNDCIFIAAPSLQDVEKQPEAKKQLWINGLKPVFVDKAYSKS
jgi:hypothetical protein